MTTHPPTTDGPAVSLRRAVLTVLASSEEEITSREVAEAVDAALGHVQHALSDLKRKGYVASRRYDWPSFSNAHVWRVTEKGLARLSGRPPVPERKVVARAPRRATAPTPRPPTTAPPRLAATAERAPLQPAPDPDDDARVLAAAKHRIEAARQDPPVAPAPPRLRRVAAAIDHAQGLAIEASPDDAEGLKRLFGDVRWIIGL